MFHLAGRAVRRPSDRLDGHLSLETTGRAKPRHGWAYLGAVFLVFACLLYYDLTRRLSLGAAWYFLPTFLAAWPLAVPAARRILRPASFWGDMLWLLAAFSLYFWASAGLMLWRTARGG